MFKYVEATDELKIVRDELKNLQDLILDLEVEKFNNLQDLSMLETRLLKYQFELKSNEVTIKLSSCLKCFFFYASFFFLASFSKTTIL